jgi:hypothetical protein
MMRDSDSRAVDAFVGLAERGIGHISLDQLELGWERMEGCLLAGVPGHRALSERSRRGRAWLAGFVTATAVAGLAMASYRALPARQEPALRYAIEGPAARTGGAISSLSEGTSRLRFSDQSSLDLGASTRLTVDALDANGAQIGLVDGAVEVYVAPRAHASWRFAAGPFRVLVKGTAFHLAFESERGHLMLQMKSGTVEVLAPPNRTIAVGKGESLELFAEPGRMQRATEPPAEPSVEPTFAAPPLAGVRPEATSTDGGRSPHANVRGVTEPARRRLAASESGDSAPVPWSRLLAKGDFAGVIAEAERRGIDNTLTQASAAELSSLADAARYTKRSDLARQVLQAMRARFAGAEPARDASFFLGRLAESTPDRSESALGWYETYLREAPRGLYAGEALGREMALLAQHAPERARKVARQYLERFPHGPQAELAHSLLEASTE